MSSLMDEEEEGAESMDDVFDDELQESKDDDDDETVQEDVATAWAHQPPLSTFHNSPYFSKSMSSSISALPPAAASSRSIHHNPPPEGWLHTASEAPVMNDTQATAFTTSANPSWSIPNSRPPVYASRRGRKRGRGRARYRGGRYKGTRFPPHSTSHPSLPTHSSTSPLIVRGGATGRFRQRSSPFNPRPSRVSPPPTLKVETHPPPLPVSNEEGEGLLPLLRAEGGEHAPRQGIEPYVEDLGAQSGNARITRSGGSRSGSWQDTALTAATSQTRLIALKSTLGLSKKPKKLANGDVVKFSTLNLFPGKPRKWRRVRKRVGNIFVNGWEPIPYSSDETFLTMQNLLATGSSGFRRTGRTTRAAAASFGKEEEPL